MFQTLGSGCKIPFKKGPLVPSPLYKKGLKMVRFIFLCMAVVALSFLSIGAQFLMDDMKDEEAAIIARNNPPQAQDVVPENAIAQEDSFSPDSLNQIETAAGGFSQEDTGFGERFTDIAPKALADDAPQTLEPATAFEVPAN